MRKRTGLHGFTALFVFSGVAARFFNPQLGGAELYRLGNWNGNTPFRIDHDETFNETDICNTRSASADHGSDLTGAMTAAGGRRSSMLQPTTTVSPDSI